MSMIRTASVAALCALATSALSAQLPANDEFGGPAISQDSASPSASTSTTSTAGEFGACCYRYQCVDFSGATAAADCAASASPEGIPGVFQGAGTTCAADGCPLVTASGACCFGAGCVTVTGEAPTFVEAESEAIARCAIDNSGVFQGVGSVCGSCTASTVTATFEPLGVNNFVFAGTAYNIWVPENAAFVAGFANPVVEDFSSYIGDPIDCNDMFEEVDALSGETALGNVSIRLLGETEDRSIRFSSSNCGFYVRSGARGGSEFVATPTPGLQPIERLQAGLYSLSTDRSANALQVSLASGDAFTAFGAQLEADQGCDVVDIDVVIGDQTYNLGAVGDIPDPNGTPNPTFSASTFNGFEFKSFLGFTVSEPITSFIIYDNACEVRLDDMTFDVVAAATGCPTLGDTNSDGIVDFADLTTLLANFNLPGGAADGDTDGSGTVDFADLTTLLANFNLPCP